MEIIDNIRNKHISIVEMNDNGERYFGLLCDEFFNDSFKAIRFNKTQAEILRNQLNDFLNGKEIEGYKGVV